jgi:hypothetical protein
MALASIEMKGAVLYIHFYFEIEDFEEGITDDLKDLIDVLSDKIRSAKFNIAFKTHGTDSNGNIIKESTILL